MDIDLAGKNEIGGQLILLLCLPIAPFLFPGVSLLEMTRTSEKSVSY
jgi:hypothetical protein